MRGVFVACCALLLSGCESDRVSIIEPAGADRAACTALVKALPKVLDGQLRRPVDPDNALGAAWGDPAFVLRCGVGKPAGYDDFPACDSVNGIDWYLPEQAVESQQSDALLTTLGRAPNVELLVPTTRRPPAAAMVQLAEVLKAHTKPASGGCH